MERAFLIIGLLLVGAVLFGCTSTQTSSQTKNQSIVQTTTNETQVNTTINITNQQTTANQSTNQSTVASNVSNFTLVNNESSIMNQSVSMNITEINFNSTNTPIGCWVANNISGYYTQPALSWVIQLYPDLTATYQITEIGSHVQTDSGNWRYSNHDIIITMAGVATYLTPYSFFNGTEFLTDGVSIFYRCS